jgi:hypothetical protein
MQSLNAATRDTMTRDLMADNLETLYWSTSDACIAAGRRWYPEASALAHAIALESGRDYLAVVGIIASLSPRTYWATNVSVARDMAHGRPGRGLTRSLAYARACREGADWRDILNGPKTRAFAMAIESAGTMGRATIDAWAVQAATAGQYGAVAACRYDDVADAYADAAERVGESVHALQAILWLTVNLPARRALEREPAMA